MVPSRVLIIDDDPLFQLLAEETFRSLGADHVMTADDGVQGLNRLRSASDGFDLVLLDLQMPNLDGVGVARAMSEMAFSGALIISSSEDESVIQAVRDMAELVGIRILGTLTKPMQESDLQALLDKPSPRSAVPSTDAVSRVALLSDLANRRIVPVYQPKLDLRTMRVDSVEILARRLLDNGSRVSAASQLQASEAYGLTTRFALAMLEQSVVDVMRIRSDGFDLNFALNISPSSLVERDLPDQFADRVRSAGLEPRNVTLEVTENRLLEFNAEVLEVLSRLRLQGFRLSVDDFGTGATSIETLRRFPFNELKIDQSFIQSASEDPVALETVMSSARIARELGLDIVAEGIETEADLRIALAAGARRAQGFLIARPKPMNRFSAWLTACAGRLAKVA